MSPSRNALRLWLLVVITLLLGTALASGWPPAMPRGCSAQTPGGDELSIRCALPSASPQGALRFVAHFSGGHDDTRASMDVMLEGAPAPCDASSKLSLFGEDGDVSLDCRFAAPPVGNAAADRLQVRLRWSHAQYTDVQLVSE